MFLAYTGTETDRSHTPRRTHNPPMMKILISDTPPYFLAPDAPVLGATKVTVEGRVSGKRDHC